MIAFRYDCKMVELFGGGLNMVFDLMENSEETGMEARDERMDCHTITTDPQDVRVH